ncbi:uncharacterized protein TRUGW13939_08655 [Talaromyces rugulosus]|uniref:Peroxisomal membrane protein PEX14 n=1 Tax=Talaromyces rugulosus TaxID=121627 RepID=A0A7H8R540_TALRU|nr:uncharacterized protein TRUGW13939_08655 [Talaromyces rugulosus]QKX61504.1 hypothetical protein TRUGW13939_08655 [Talaromyces rugulosus]
MAGDSKPVIPEWQRKATPSPPAHASAAITADDASDNASPESSPPEDRSALLEQARNFLSEPSISDAPTSRKIEFLESKGLTNGEIQALLGVSRNEDASSPSSETTNDSDKTTATENNAPAETQTTVSTLSNNNAAATASSTTTTTTTTNNTTPQRDVPPIITYPEFLVNASAQNNKPPLISFQGVLYSLYAAAGLGATLYGSSEYLVKPMLKTLTEARHDFAETALNNLTTLNEKLEQNVSKIPANIIPKPTSEEEDDDEETESITSDPTELFHRDVATQTSPDLLSDSPPSEEKNADSESSAIKAIDTHTERLSTLTSHLKEFVTDHTSSRKVDDSARDKISDLQSYLDGLTYSSSNNYLGNNAMYNIYGSSSGDMGRNRSGSTDRKEQDAVTTFKAEIRGVKGALLSARNFPAGKAGVAR